MLAPAVALGITLAAGGVCHDVAPLPVRRLTRVEYEGSVRDLLGTNRRLVDTFPADDGVGGYAANARAALTRLAMERYLETAQSLAAEADLGSLLPCDPTVAGEPACGDAFLVRFLRRAFRRPATADELRRYRAAFESHRRREGFAAAARQVVAAALSSPSFLYRAEGPPAFALASRPSYFLWSSAPDERLLSVAEDGTLTSRPVLEAEARRLLADPRLGDTVRSFHTQWLEITRRPDKSRRAYPAWNESLWDSMHRETSLFVEHLFRDGGATFPALLSAPWTFVDARLAKLYGLPAPAAGGFWRVTLPPGARAGVLTQPSVLAAHALPDQPSPIHRGKWVRERLLCQEVPPPPGGVDITPPKVDPSKPTKERFEDHRLQGICSKCHALMDPIGFGFQHYDGIGAWQDRDGDHPVDAVGELAGSEDADGEFDGAPALAARLAASGEAQRCLIEQWLRFALGPVDPAALACAAAEIHPRFVASGLDLRELLIAVATSDLFLGDNQ